MPPMILSSDSHVFEPPDLWQTRIDAPFHDRAPRIQRIDGADQIVVEADQILSGIGLISNAGARFEAPETISAQGRFEDVHRGGYDPEQHLKDMALDGVSGEVLYPSQGLFYFKVADTALMSAIFRAYNDWLAEFCRADPARLKGIAMINLDDVQDAIRELEELGELAAGAIEKRLAAKPPLEVQQRLQVLRDRLRSPLAAGQVVQALRAIEVLERIGTAEAQELLERMAGGAGEAPRATSVPDGTRSVPSGTEVEDRHAGDRDREDGSVHERYHNEEPE